MMSSEFIEELEALQSVYSDITLRTIDQGNDIIAEHSSEHSSSSRNSTVFSSILPLVNNEENGKVLEDTKDKRGNRVEKEKNIKNGMGGKYRNEKENEKGVDSDILTVISLTCTPRSTSTSFVLTEIECSVPSSYPNAHPSVKIMKTSGLNDEGMELKNILDEFIKESSLGECLLFQIIDKVFDFLDECHIGECSLCSEELAAFDYTGVDLTLKNVEKRINGLENKLYGLKTPCNHCFHMCCLAKWGAIKTIQKDNNKKGNCWIEERDENNIKFLEGSIRGEENEIIRINNERDIITEKIKTCELLILQDEKMKKIEKEKTDKMKNIAVHNKPANGKSLPSQNPLSPFETAVSALKLSIKENRTKLSDIVILTQKTKGIKERNKLNEETLLLREKLLEEETELDRIITKKDAKDDSAPKDAESNLESLKISLIWVDEKLSKVTKKLQTFQADLTTQTTALKEKTREKNLSRTFPCAYCRTDISSSNCFLLEHRNEKIVFDKFLEIALQKENDQSEKSQGDKGDTAQS